MITDVMLFTIAGASQNPYPSFPASIGGQLGAIQPDWKEGDPCFGPRLTFDSSNVMLGSCAYSYVASPWPWCHVGPEIPPCHALHMASNCLAKHNSFSPMAAGDTSESVCSDARPFHHAILNDQVASPVMMDWTPDHGWLAAIPRVCWMQPLISTPDLPSLCYSAYLASSL